MTPDQIETTTVSQGAAAHLLPQALCLFRASDGQLLAFSELAAQWLGLAEKVGTTATLAEIFPAAAQRISKQGVPLASVFECPGANRQREHHHGSASLHVRFSGLTGPGETFLLATLSPQDPSPATPDPSPYRHDALTGLPDRTALDSVAAIVGNDTIAVLFADLNGFKRVNDQHSHAAGDLVLQELARRCQDAVREDDLLVRYGGDEFVFILPGITTTQAADVIVKRLQRAVAEPLAIEKEELRISVSIGVAIGTTRTDTIAELVHKADQAMYAAKRAEQ